MMLKLKKYIKIDFHIYNIIVIIFLSNKCSIRDIKKSYQSQTFEQ